MTMRTTPSRTVQGWTSGETDQDAAMDDAGSTAGANSGGFASLLRSGPGGRLTKWANRRRKVVGRSFSIERWPRSWLLIRVGEATWTVNLRQATNLGLVGHSLVVDGHVLADIPFDVAERQSAEVRALIRSSIPRGLLGALTRWCLLVSGCLLGVVFVIGLMAQSRTGAPSADPSMVSSPRQVLTPGSDDDRKALDRLLRGDRGAPPPDLQPHR